MATAKITKRAVDALAGAGREAFLWDDELRGFGVRVASSGVRSYVFAYRMGGREAQKRRFTIGPHGSPWTPATARKEAERLAHLVAQGTDPLDHSRERRRQAVDLAFAAYVELFARNYLRARWKRSEAGRRLLVAVAVPVLGSKPLPAITRADISAVLDTVADRPATARLVHATLRKLFRWAAGRGDLERSPVEDMEVPPAVAARERVLTDEELHTVWMAAGELGFPFGPMIRVLIASGQRRDEVAGLAWGELDRASRTWTLPASRAKNKQAHIVPLNALASAELDAMAVLIQPPKEGKPIEWPRAGLVFSTNGRTAASGHSKAKARLDAKVSKMLGDHEPPLEDDLQPTLPAWRVHDLRRTLATGLQRLGVRFEVTEAVLNHTSGARGGIAGVYQRHDWKEEKRAALDAWARHLESLSEPKPVASNVIAIGARA